MKPLFLALTLLSVVATAAGEVELIPSLIESQSEMDLSAIVNARVLEKLTTKSTTIGLVTIDLSGNHTDVSPQLGHYLTFRRTAESSIRRSVYAIGASWGIESVRMVRRGVYEMVLKQINTFDGKANLQKLEINIEKLLKADEAHAYREFENVYLESYIEVKHLN